MPLIEVELVTPADAPMRAGLTQALADALGRVFGSPPGRTWVRLRLLPAEQYAENDVRINTSSLPVFVTVLHAHPPQGLERAAEVVAVTRAAASCLERSDEQVHVQYAPAAAGRQAFGGKLVE